MIEIMPDAQRERCEEIVSWKWWESKMIKYCERNKSQRNKLLRVIKGEETDLLKSKVGMISEERMGAFAKALKFKNI